MKYYTKEEYELYPTMWVNYKTECWEEKKVEDLIYCRMPFAKRLHSTSFNLTSSKVIVELANE